MVLKFKLLFILMALTLISVSQELFKEQYRPQYHLSPQWGWMGDPNGMIYFNGSYHILWWGHAKSDDLVHWEEYSHHAMNGGPGGFGYWSGSVVADINNTAGFNNEEDTALVAIYTMHYDNTNYEKVGLSSSLNHVSFEYYEGNPVISTDQYDFRDPTVFWHDATNRWIMAITRSVERSIEFYASNDLKDWIYLSNFNEKGAKNQVWEVPDLFSLPLNGNSDSIKWVLTCGMGPNKMQYWIGDFDGSSFILDTLDNHLTGKNIPGVVFEDFEGDAFGDWTVEGDAFGDGPVDKTLPDQQNVNGWIGKGYINSYHNGDASTGKLISPEFTIEKKYINFLIGGGAAIGNQIRLFVNGNAVLTSSSVNNQELLRWESMDVTEYIGKSAHIEVVDETTIGWGHILLDQIIFADVKYNMNIENANWADWGTDFYAARSYRNYTENSLTSKIWIGWMGNWSYARDVPTDPWKGHQSIPRELELQYNEDGYLLIQKPLPNLTELRKNEYSLTNFEVNEQYILTNFDPDWNVYEFKIKFEISDSKQVFGINLAESSDSKKLVVGYDANTSQVFIKRRGLSHIFSNPSYTSTIFVPIALKNDSIIDFHIFMDQSSVEVFVNEYHTTISALAFNKNTENNISLYSENGTTKIISMQAWELESIWGVLPSDLPNKIVDEAQKECLLIYPNPIKVGENLNIVLDEVLKENKYNYFIYNSQGQLIISTLTDSITIKENIFRPGIYLISAIDDNGFSWVKKFIVY